MRAKILNYPDFTDRKCCLRRSCNQKLWIQSKTCLWDL